MAHEFDLLSLPDDLLAIVALKTRNQLSAWKPWERTPEPLKDWARAASTCKRLFKMQLPSDPVVRSWESLEWHLKRFQGAKAIHVHIEKWPSNDRELSELSDSLQKVSCNLQRLVELEFLPSRRSMQPLSPWITAMLSGASSLTHLRLSAELLPCLPIPGRKALKSLQIDAKNLLALAYAMQTVIDYQQLRNLTIFCAYGCTVPHGSGICELDLRHLVHLRKCHLRWVLVLDKVRLPQGELELTVMPSQVAAWSKLWSQVQGHVHAITVEEDLPFGLQDWPPGIDACHGLQFLRVDCGNLGPGNLDLAHLAFIPHVSLYSSALLMVKISRGSWKVLELQSAGHIYVDLDDAKGFIESTETFCFTFGSRMRSEMTSLIKTLKTAGADIGKAVYEYPDMTSPLRSTGNDAPIVALSNRQQACNAEEGAFMSARRRHSTLS